MKRAILICTLTFYLNNLNAQGKHENYGARLLPTFPGGRDSLQSYISTHLQWPGPMWDGQGTVKVQITVDKTGKIIKAEILKSLGVECDREVNRFVKSMPRWQPALDANNRPVKAKALFDLRFQMME